MFKIGKRLTTKVFNASRFVFMQIDRVSREIQEAIVQEEQNGKVSDRLDELLRKKEALRRQQSV